MRQQNIVFGLILILLGLYFFIVNVFGLGGWTFLIAIGLALIGGYLWSNQYGLLIGGCIVAAVGTFAGLEETGVIGAEGGAWFFVVLGLGFIAIYLLSRAWQRWWPLVPGLILITIGLFIIYAPRIPLTWEQWLALAQWWPLVLVVLGIWLLVRNYVPTPARNVVGAAVTILFIGSVVLLALSAGAVATSGSGLSIGPEFTERVEQELAAPTEGQLVVTSNVGSIKVLPSNGPNIRVVAIKRAFAPSSEQAKRHLEGITVNVDRLGNEVQVSASISSPSSQRGLDWFGQRAWVDFEIYSPPTLGLRAVTSTGSITVEGAKGGIEARTSTGSIKMRDVAGPVAAETSTGSIDVQGLINRESTLRTSTGSITLSVAPESAFDVEARVSTGRIHVGQNLPIAIEKQEDRALLGAVNGGGPLLHLRTSTGSITIKQGS